MLLISFLILIFLLGRYVPSVCVVLLKNVVCGDQVPRPDGKADGLGLTVLDEPCAKQSDPTVLSLWLSENSKQHNVTVSGHTCMHYLFFKYSMQYGFEHEHCAMCIQAYVHTVYFYM